jgi:hypothetical protein
MVRRDPAGPRTSRPWRIIQSLAGKEGVMRVGARSGLLFGVVAILCAAPAFAQVRFEAFTLGYRGAAHTGPSGQQATWLEDWASEVIVGVSIQYAGTDTGQNLWVFIPATGRTTALGMLDEQHTRADGIRNSALLGPREGVSHPFLFGTSTRYNGQASAGLTAWRHHAASAITLTISLSGLEYTSTANVRSAAVHLKNPAGDAAGACTRYTGDLLAGQAAWFLARDSGFPVRIGLFDPVHTAPLGIPSQSSSAKFMNGSGAVAGTSALYHSASMPPGQSAWAFNPFTDQVTRIGIFDAEHVDPSGYHFSDVFGISEAGLVFGTTHRFVNSQFRGDTPWVHDLGTGTTVSIGLTGAEFTASNGLRMTAGYRRISAAHLPIGASLRYDGGNAHRGQKAWYYDPATATTVAVGFTGGVYTSPDGMQVSSLADAGAFCVGSSVRYAASGSDNGAALWVHSSSTGMTTRIGLADAAHTDWANGYQYSEARYTEPVMPSGFLIGLSERGITAPIRRPETVWAYNPGTQQMVLLGLYGPDFADSSGYADGYVIEADAGGRYVIGYTSRLALAGGGQGAWVADLASGQSTRVGVFDAAHTSSSGMQYSWPTLPVGNLAVARSTRYSGTAENGSSAVIYDLSDGAMIPLVFSVSPSDRAYTAGAASEMGAVLGVYRDYSIDPAGPFRTFYWTREGGVAPLDLLVIGGFESAGYFPIQVEGRATFSPAGLQGMIAYTGGASRQGAVYLRRHRGCVADFNGDGDAGTDADIEAFFACLAGNCCAACASIDFNGDGDSGTDADIESFFRVLAGGPC